ncbi:MAG: GntR family transcriptional regulator [Gemmatimonadaceae bacterium]
MSSRPTESIRRNRAANRPAHTGAGIRAGARLPAISDMARQFGVGSPTLREVLKKLETVGVVVIRHGSGA